jgi:hypothetical protein
MTFHLLQIIKIIQEDIEVKYYAQGECFSLPKLCVVKVWAKKIPPFSGI